MPRLARTKSKSGFYHILLRGISRQNIFEDDEDCYHFLETLKRYKIELGFEIHSYCLMGNHVHLLLKDVKDQLDLIMKKTAGSYAYYFNRKYDRVGHVFQDRFKSEVIEDDEYFLTVIRYIHQNPPKAKIEQTNKYKWSSYKEFVGNAMIVDKLFALQLLGGIEKFIEFIDVEEDDDRCLEISDYNNITDKKAKEILLKEYGISSFFEISKLELKERNLIIHSLKKRGLSVRQISRLTGLNRGVVQRA